MPAKAERDPGMRGPAVATASVSDGPSRLASKS